MPFSRGPISTEWTWRQVAWMPLPLLTLAILLLSRYNVQLPPHSVFVIPFLNALCKTVIYSLIAILLARSFLQKGAPPILLLGSGMLVFGLSSGLAGFIWPVDDGKSGIVVHNLGALAAGFCHLCGALLVENRPVPESKRGVLLPAAFLVVTLFAVGTAVVTLEGGIPSFMDNAGFIPTPLRQIVMGLAAGFFLVASLLFGFKYERDRSPFVLWYSVGLGLTALGLLAMVMQRGSNDMMSWAGRAGQYLGALYILFSLVQVLRKNREWDIPLDAALRESEARYRALVDLVPDAVLVVQDARIVYGNVASLRLLGVRDEGSLFSHQAIDFLPPDERLVVPRQIEGTLRTSRLLSHEGHILRPDGRVVPMEARLSGIDWKGHPAVLVAVRDMTERRRNETAMKESEARYKRLYDNMREAKRETEAAAAELARSNRDLEQFASVSSHDLKEPLRMVTSFLSLLKERLDGRLDLQSEDYIKIAMTSATRMQELIDDLLVYSCVGREAATSVVSAAEAAALVVRNLEAGLREADATIRVGPLPAVRSHAGELAQVFQNLISNAVKFRGARKLEIEAGAERDGAYWRFFVRDNGIGIDPVYQNRLFKIFNRLHTTDEYPGTGIGLAVCKKIVDRQGGRIWVDSETGRGSTFFFTLPALTEEEPRR